MNAKISASSVTKLDMRFENEGGTCDNCRFDAQTGSGDNTIRYEFKSYGPDTRIKQTGQFISYIEEATSLKSFKYVFNKKKLGSGAKAKARDKMKTFIVNHKTEIFASMTTELKQELGIDDSSDLGDSAIVNRMTDSFVEVF